MLSLAVKAVVKFGGSAITNKANRNPSTHSEILEQPEKYLRLDVMEKIAESVHSVMHDKSDLELVLITGAGCCGHPQVKAGFPPEEIHNVACIPALYLQNLLQDQNLQSFLISPYNIVVCTESSQQGGTNYDISSLWRALQNPDWRIRISHGDVVPMVQGKKGRLGNYEVISGDDLVVDIGAMWPADQVIMVSDIDAVYTSDPKYGNNARKIDKIVVKKKFDDDKQFRLNMAEAYDVIFADTKDVTKGLFGKVSKLCDFTYKTGIKSQIVGIDSLEDALKGKSAGTLITRA